MPGGKDKSSGLKTGKDQGARTWSGNVFKSLGAAALKAAAAAKKVTVRYEPTLRY